MIGRELPEQLMQPTPADRGHLALTSPEQDACAVPEPRPVCQITDFHDFGVLSGMTDSFSGQRLAQECY